MSFAASFAQQPYTIPTPEAGPSYTISTPVNAFQYRYQAGTSVPGHSSQTLQFVDASVGPLDYISTPCPDCGQVIKVSSCTSYHMDKHRESQRCKKAAARRVMHRETAMATALRTQLFHTQGRRGSGGGNGSDKTYAEAGIQTTPAEVMPMASPWIREVRRAKTPRRCQSEPPPVVIVEVQEAVQAKPPDADTERAPDAPRSSGTACYQCGQAVSAKNMRNHVGGHVLRGLVGAPEARPLGEPVHVGNPCGFCGRAGCDIKLVKTQSPASTYTAAASSCPRAHIFSLNKARRFSTVMPCTNVPIHCALCPKDPETRLRPVFWKYNVFHHIQTAHPAHWDWSARKTCNLPKTFRKLLAISQEELEVVAPGHQLPYPGPVGDGDEEEDASVVSNKRAAVEAMLQDVESVSKRAREA